MEINRFSSTVIPIVILLSILSFSQPASGLTVLGVNIDSVNNIKACVRNDPEESDSPCFTTLYNRSGNAENSYGITTIIINFSNDNKPRILRHNYAGASLINDKIVYLQFSTHGFSTERSDLSALENKFGKPTKISTDTVENAMGAKFQKINASWNINNKITVNYNSIDNNIFSGTISVIVNKYIKIIEGKYVGSDSSGL